jgi:hypothetical protein
VAVSVILNLFLFGTLSWVFNARVPVWGYALLGFQCGRIAYVWSRRP